MSVKVDEDQKEEGIRNVCCMSKARAKEPSPSLELIWL